MSCVRKIWLPSLLSASVAAAGCGGSAGNNGVNGAPALVAAASAANCPYGGVAVSVGTGPASYVCNGTPGLSGALQWTAVAADTSAQANHGYSVNTATPVTITLPASSGLNLGDMVEVQAVGTGGVTVATNAGQSILFGSEVTNWFPRAINHGYLGIASSADGIHLAATTNGGQIWTSADSGATWTAWASTQYWYRIASSADGTHLAAASGQIWTSSTADGAARSLTLPYGSSATLSYEGSGQFLVGAATGSVFAY